MYLSQKDYWKDFAHDARRLGSRLYERLALDIDGDAALKALTDGRRKGQPAANLLLGAVHFLILRGARHPLRDLYATAGGTWRGEDVFAPFRDFVARHEDAVRHLIETRVTNTNEVGRSAVLRAGFGALAQREPAPLHLIEVGPSAGLNLIWDRYGVRYCRGGATAIAVDPQAALILDCDLQGTADPPVRAAPAIAGRVGLELNPVDLSDPDDRDWLRALVWPDQPARLARLDAAIALFGQTLCGPIPVDIRAGDALALLPDALAQVPAGAAACVFHTIAVYQFSAAMQAALDAILVMAGLRRPVWHLAFEFEGGSDYALTLTRHQDSLKKAERLALAQPHGAWIAWQG